MRRNFKVHFAQFSYEDSDRGTTVVSHPICRSLDSCHEGPCATHLTDDDREVTCKRCLVLLRAQKGG